jgi:hypothetical protein
MLCRGLFSTWATCLWLESLFIFSFSSRKVVGLFNSISIKMFLYTFSLFLLLGLIWVSRIIYVVARMIGAGGPYFGVASFHFPSENLMPLPFAW